MVAVRELLAREIVHRVGDALREATAVHEDERRAVLAHELQESRVDRRPDARARVGARGRSAAEFEGLAQTRHVLDRHFDHEIKGLAVTGVHDAHRSRSVRIEPAEAARDLFQRALRRGKADALEPASGQTLEALEGQREVGAALGGHDGVDLVDDDRFDVAQRLTRG